MSQLALEKFAADQTDPHASPPDARRSGRSEVRGRVEVEGRSLPKGSRLFDMSVGGAAVVYPLSFQEAGTPLCVDDEVVLYLRGRAKLPGRVVRLFDGGFAIEFDWSLDIEPGINLR